MHWTIVFEVQNRHISLLVTNQQKTGGYQFQVPWKQTVYQIFCVMLVWTWTQTSDLDLIKMKNYKFFSATHLIILSNFITFQLVDLLNQETEVAAYDRTGCRVQAYSLSLNWTFSTTATLVTPQYVLYVDNLYTNQGDFAYTVKSAINNALNATQVGLPIQNNVKGIQLYLCMMRFSTPSLPNFL